MGRETVEKTFGDLFGWLATSRGDLTLDKNGLKQRKMLAYQIDFAQDAAGDWSYDVEHITNIQLVDWDTWVELPVRPFDLYVDTSKKRVRVPRVVKCLFTEEMPVKRWQKTLDTVYEIYQGICQYSKQKISKNEASRDHRIPLSRGGADNLSNILLSRKDINHKKGNKLNHEIGLPNVPSIVPRDIPMCDYMRNTDNVPEWDLFLTKGKHAK